MKVRLTLRRIQVAEIEMDVEDPTKLNELELDSAEVDAERGQDWRDEEFEVTSITPL